MRISRIVRLAIVTGIPIIIVLSSLIERPVFAQYSCDVDGDGKEGLAEAIHALQVASGFLSSESNDQACSDGIDNDDDTYIDCDDYDCIGTTPCLGEENNDQTCSDGIDNDGDNYIDCDDFGCAGTTPCP